MNFLIAFVNFLQELFTFIGYIFLVMLMFIILNSLLDAGNACSSFSDTQDLCSKG